MKQKAPTFPLIHTSIAASVRARVRASVRTGMGWATPHFNSFSVSLHHVYIKNHHLDRSPLSHDHRSGRGIKYSLSVIRTLSAYVFIRFDHLWCLNNAYTAITYSRTSKKKAQNLRNSKHKKCKCNMPPTNAYAHEEKNPYLGPGYAPKERTRKKKEKNADPAC